MTHLSAVYSTSADEPTTEDFFVSHRNNAITVTYSTLKPLKLEYTLNNALLTPYLRILFISYWLVSRNRWNWFEFKLSIDSTSFLLSKKSEFVILLSTKVVILELLCLCALSLEWYYSDENQSLNCKPWGVNCRAYNRRILGFGQASFPCAREPK